MATRDALPNRRNTCLMTILGTGIGVLVLAVISLAAEQVVPYAGAQSATVNVSGCVPEPTEVTPAITSPASGLTTNQATVTLKGTATPNLDITVIRNGLAAGTTLANGNGQWSIQITLLPGLNTLSAKHCLSSAPITVTYTPPPAPLSQPGRGALREQQASNVEGVDQAVPPAPASSFFLIPEAGLVTTEQNDDVILAFTIVGGEPPYRIVADRGDGAVTEQLAEAAGQMSIRHRYTKRGTYLVLVTVNDRAGRQAVVSFVVRVKAAYTQVESRLARPTRTLPFVILLELLLALATFSFWQYEHERRARPTSQPPSVARGNRPSNPT